MRAWRLALALFGQLLSRLLFAAFLVFATYNPTGRSFAHWVRRADVAVAWRLAVAGLLLVTFAAVLRMAARALGLIGLLFCVVIASGTVWVLWDAGWLALPDAQARTWFLLSAAAFSLGVGLCWVKISGGLDGQLRTVDVTS